MHSTLNTSVLVGEFVSTIIFWTCIQMHASFVALLAVGVDLLSEGDRLFVVRVNALGQSRLLSPERRQLSPIAVLSLRKTHIVSLILY